MTKSEGVGEVGLGLFSYPKAVFGTIPSIPIPTPLANFGIELTLHSNSTLGIVASTPIPTQRNWGDSTGIPISKFPTLCSPLKRRKS